MIAGEKINVEAVVVKEVECVKIIMSFGPIAKTQTFTIKKEERDPQGFFEKHCKDNPLIDGFLFFTQRIIAIDGIEYTSDQFNESDAFECTEDGVVSHTKEEAMVEIEKMKLEKKASESPAQNSFVVPGPATVN